ncbi:MAG: hypothetical protein ABR968_04920 [Bacteroidales bacterium]
MSKHFKYLILGLLIIFGVRFGCCQKTGNVDMVVSDTRINTLIEKHIAFSENRGSIRGFRIQIFFDSGNNSKNSAVAAMNGFKAKYPNVEAYLIYHEPNYKIRVGDFRCRMDAQRFLYNISGEYENAFIVKDDEINLPDLEEDDSK